MALVVFLRGVNVGGSKTFAKQVDGPGRNRLQERFAELRRIVEGL